MRRSWMLRVYEIYFGVVPYLFYLKDRDIIVILLDALHTPGRIVYDLRGSFSPVDLLEDPQDHYYVLFDRNTIDVAFKCRRDAAVTGPVSVLICIRPLTGILEDPTR